VADQRAPSGERDEWPDPTTTEPTPVPGGGHAGTDELARQGPDVLLLVVALLTLAMAVVAFVGRLPELGWVHPGWVFSVGALVVGGVGLAAALRRRR